MNNVSRTVVITPPRTQRNINPPIETFDFIAECDKDPIEAMFLPEISVFKVCKSIAIIVLGNTYLSVAYARKCIVSVANKDRLKEELGRIVYHD